MKSPKAEQQPLQTCRWSLFWEDAPYRTWSIMLQKTCSSMAASGAVPVANDSNAEETGAGARTSRGSRSGAEKVAHLDGCRSISATQADVLGRRF